MKVAEQYELCAPFFERLGHAPERILLLDYDGTLAPFTPERMRAFPYREIPQLISNIMRKNTRVVLISGRSARELLFLSGIHPQPEIWGSHGAERLFADGSYEVEAPDAEHRRALQRATQALRAGGLGDRLELKPGSVAVHWRGLAAAEQAATESLVRETCQPLVDESGLELLPFDGGLELHSPGKHKGDAVNTVLNQAHPGFAAAYLGDDETDENAFRAIKGRGLGVLVRTEFRPTRADVWLRPPDELGRFLRDWLLACGAEK
jgi:trehalose-phosphatase